MAELLKYSFQSTDFYMDTGIAKVKNLGTLGAANDGTMYTGRGLYTNGQNKIRTIYPDFLASGGSIVKHTVDSIGCDGLDDGTNACYVSKSECCIGSIYVPLNISDRSCRMVAVSDNSRVSVYCNGTSIASATGTGISGTFSQPYQIGVRSDGTSKESGTHMALIFIAAQMTDSDVVYDFENPEAIIAMAITGEQDLNFSFAASAIVHAFTFDESTGSNVYDLVTGVSYRLIDFPIDNSQWRTGIEYGHQMARFKQGLHNLPSSIAVSGTIRFDEIVQIETGVIPAEVYDNSGVTTVYTTSGTVPVYETSIVPTSYIENSGDTGVII